MLRMNIRTLMFLVLYSAVALGLFMPALRAPESQRFDLLGVAMVGIPLVLAGLSWLIHRPGPRRDWLVGFFAWCTFVVLGSLFAIAGSHNNDLRSYWLAGLCLASAVVFAWRRLLPEECPACRKRGLLNAIPSSVPKNPPFSAVAHLCESCGVVMFSRRGGDARRLCDLRKEARPDQLAPLGALYLRIVRPDHLLVPRADGPRLLALRAESLAGFAGPRSLGVLLVPRLRDAEQAAHRRPLGRSLGARRPQAVCAIRFRWLGDRGSVLARLRAGGHSPSRRGIGGRIEGRSHFASGSVS